MKNKGENSKGEKSFIPEPKEIGFLTGGAPMPDEFRPHGIRVLIEKPEFRLVEIWRHSGSLFKVEWCEAVRMAYIRSGANKQQARRNTELKEVLAMVDALIQLADYTKDGEGSRTICDAMAHALAGSLQAIERAKDGTNAAIAIENAIALCARAFSGFAAMAGSKDKDGRRNTSKPMPADLIKIAEFLIEGQGRVPSKDEIRKFAEGIGLRITGKRNIAAEWMQLFTDACLGGLPSAPE